MREEICHLAWILGWNSRQGEASACDPSHSPAGLAIYKALLCLAPPLAATLTPRSGWRAPPWRTGWRQHDWIQSLAPATVLPSASLPLPSLTQSVSPDSFVLPPPDRSRRGRGGPLADRSPAGERTAPVCLHVYSSVSFSLD